MIEKYNSQQNKNGAAWLLTKQLVSWIQVFINIYISLIIVGYIDVGDEHDLETKFLVTEIQNIRIVINITVDF